VYFGASFISLSPRGVDLVRTVSFLDGPLRFKQLFFPFMLKPQALVLCNPGPFSFDLFFLAVASDCPRFSTSAAVFLRENLFIF